MKGMGMVAKSAARHRGGGQYRSRNTHKAHPVLQAQRFGSVPDICNHCDGTGICPTCLDENDDGCGECRAFRAGACSACDGQGDHS